MNEKKFGDADCSTKVQSGAAGGAAILLPSDEDILAAKPEHMFANPKHKDVFSTADAAKFLGIDRSTLQRWAKRKDFFEPFMRDFKGNALYSREQLEQLKSLNVDYSKLNNLRYGYVFDKDGNNMLLCFYNQICQNVKMSNWRRHTDTIKKFT